MSRELTKCRYFTNGECRSCSYMEVPYEEQIRKKEEVLISHFNSASINVETLLPTVTSTLLLGSRNKAKFIVAGNIENPVLGIVDNKQETTDLSACSLHLPAIQKLPPIFKRIITQFRLSPYSIKKDKGELKAIIVRVSESTGECIVRFVLRSNELEKPVAGAARELQLQCPEVKVVSINIQPIHQSILEGPEERIISKSSFIEEMVNGYQCSVSPQSFSQVTSNVSEKLYLSASQIVSKLKPKLALDLFCGTGNFSIMSSQYCEKIVGIELSKSSISDAKRGATWNKLGNIDFFEADTLAWLKLYDGESPDLIIVNPPRRGMGVNICSEIKRLTPKYLIYSSCNAASLTSDLKHLDVTSIKSAEIFDMFPLTEHFETLVFAEFS